MRSSGDTASITAASLGLGNVANTSPSDLPISIAVSSAMNLKANLSGASMTGTITAPTIHASTSWLVGGTSINDIYLRTSKFNNAIGSYVLHTNFDTTIGNDLFRNNFNTTIGNYVLNTNFNTTIGNYVLATGFNTTIGNYVLNDNFNTRLEITY